MKDVDLRQGDCLERMSEMPDASVDSVVTDPPYGLGFMGKKWDVGVPAVEVFEQCLRVLKPGGHLVAFGGSRTYHRLAVAVEDAGFEIRDQIMWVYGSGFPKSQNVSKQIDKHNGDPRRLWRFTEWMRSTGMTAQQLNEITGTDMGGHYLTAKSQPAIPTPKLWAQIRPYCGNVPAWVDELVERIEAERELVGVSPHSANRTSGAIWGGTGTEPSRNVTAPNTEAARQWDGWGTALKPAHEPIVVARKPLTGTVANNVMEYGTGAINVDGCRVGNEMITSLPSRNSDNHHYAQDEWTKASAIGEKRTYEGRFPANLIHDGSDEVLGLFPVTTSGALNAGHKQGEGSFGKIGGDKILKNYGGDKGSAARFFYTAKASKRDRGEGNTHPTVKPTDLMRYLCRMVTPPGGTVLDPFMGSGSTGKAAAQEGFGFIGIELSDEYFQIAQDRIAGVLL